MTLKRVDRTPLSEQVARQIARSISKGRYKPGQRLPSESELCEVFGVGRSTLWEALRSLAFIGTVEIRHGAGTYVGNGSKQPGVPYSAIGSKALMDLDALWQARVILEPELAALFAETATSEELRSLDQLLEKMERSVRSRKSQFAELDLAFHLAIAAGSKNPVLEGFFHTVRRPLQGLMRNGVKGPVAGGVERAYMQHVKIVKALQDHDPQRARGEMQSHLQTFYRGYKILLRDAGSKSKARDRRRKYLGSAHLLGAV